MVVSFHEAIIEASLGRFSHALSRKPRSSESWRGDRSVRGWSSDKARKKSAPKSKARRSGRRCRETPRSPVSSAHSPKKARQSTRRKSREQPESQREQKSRKRPPKATAQIKLDQGARSKEFRWQKLDRLVPHSGPLRWQHRGRTQPECSARRKWLDRLARQVMERGRIGK